MRRDLNAWRQRRGGIVLPILIFLMACSSSTGRPIDTDGDADTDSDVEIDTPCATRVDCEHAGFDAEYSIDVEAEVIEVDDDQVVMLGVDGVPISFAGCGLDLAGVIRPGHHVTARNIHAEGWGDCWIGQVLVDGEPVLLGARCDAEEGAPPLDELGWSIELEPECRGSLDHVCSVGEDLVRLAIPETVFNAQITTETGAQETVPLGSTTRVGGWQVRLLDARATEVVEERGCFVPASGTFLMVAAQQLEPRLCPEPPEVARGALGLSFSASQTGRQLVVDTVGPEQVVLISDEGTEITFGWYGPNPRQAVPEGSVVTARRYDQTTTNRGFLDVLEVDGRVALAVTSSDDFILELPNLDAIGIGLELGEPCTFVEGVAECTGDTLVGQRYPVILTPEGDDPAEVEIGSMISVGPWVATLIEASQYPGMACPDYHVEAWGPFGITLMQE